MRSLTIPDPSIDRPPVPCALPPLPSFNHLPPTPVFHAGAMQTGFHTPSSSYVFHGTMESHLRLHDIDDKWHAYLHAVVVADPPLAELAALCVLLAWGWDYRVAKSTVRALLMDGELKSQGDPGTE